MKHSDLIKLNSQFDSILNVIEKAIASCNNAGVDSQNHFADVSKMVDSSEKRFYQKIRDIYKLAVELVTVQGEMKKNLKELGYES